MVLNIFLSPGYQTLRLAGTEQYLEKPFLHG